MSTISDELFGLFSTQIFDQSVFKLVVPTALAINYVDVTEATVDVETLPCQHLHWHKMLCDYIRPFVLLHKTCACEKRSKSKNHFHESKLEV